MYNSSIISILLLTFAILGVFFGYLYICWKKSSYKSISKYGFFTVHTSIFYENIPRLLHPFLKEYLGLYGEYDIYRVLEKIPGNKKILINLYLPQGETVTDTEIDILFIHETGIYIIESKDFGGWIYGSEQDKYWTQSFSKYRKYPFYNPIHQNYSHLKSLEKLIPEYIPHIKPLIVFSNRSELKKLSCSHNTVIQKGELKNEILKHDQTVFSQSTIDSIAGTLEKYMNHSKIQEQVHIQEIKALQNT